MDRARKIQLTKLVVGKVATYGSGVITYATISNQLPELPLPKKVATFVAAVAISSIVSDAVQAKTDNLIDQLVAIYDKVKKN